MTSGGHWFCEPRGARCSTTRGGGHVALQPCRQQGRHLGRHNRRRPGRDRVAHGQRRLEGRHATAGCLAPHTPLPSPWSATLMGSRVRPGPATLRYSDWVLGCPRKAGSSSEMAARAFWVLDSYISGFVTQQASMRLEEPAAKPAGEYTRSLSTEDYPHPCRSGRHIRRGTGLGLRRRIRIRPGVDPRGPRTAPRSRVTTFSGPGQRARALSVWITPP